MEKEYLRLLKRHASLPNIYFLLLFNLILLWVIMPAATLGVTMQTNSAQFIEDIAFYSPAEFYQIIKNYGEVGRLNYRFMLLTVELVFPLVYAVFLSFLAFWIGSNLDLKINNKYYFLPFSFLILELLENISLLFLLNQFPVEYPSIASFLMVLTLIKWGVLISLSLALFTGLIILFKQSLS